MSKLPDTLSGLLRAAVTDAKKAEASEGHTLDMNEWHTAGWEKEPCKVCMAGAVMAFTLEGNPMYDYTPSLFQEEKRKLHVIDAMRTGNMSGAFRDLHGIESVPEEYEPSLDEAKALRYAGDLIYEDFDENAHDRASWDVYLEAAEALEEAGL